MIASGPTEASVPGARGAVVGALATVEMNISPGAAAQCESYSAGDFSDAADTLVAAVVRSSWRDAADV